MRRILVSLLLAGCLSSTPASTDAPPSEAPEPTWSLDAPIQVNSFGAGYEPSIRVAADGTTYITAHKQSPAAEGTRLASWLWYSLDGQDWRDMPSFLSAHEALWALEGDLAIDGAGTVYFVDTYAVDQTISRWVSSTTGPTWLDTRPVVATESLDDRPWLDAHGDGVLYLISNHGPDGPTPASIAATGDPTQGDRMWFYASEDGGTTWSQRHGFTGAWWCGVTASQVNDHDVFVGCVLPGWLPSNIRENYLGQDVTFESWFFVSHDRGSTWTAHHIADYATRNGLLYPQPATDGGGNMYHVYVDDDAADDKATILNVARPGPAGWDVLDVTPFNGSIQRIWARGGPDGHLAITFYGSDDNLTNEASPWHVYAYVTQDAMAETPSWTLLRLDDAPVAHGTGSPADFFQNAWGPDGNLHVAYQRVRDDGSGSDILYTRGAFG